MRFLYKINSVYDGFRPATIPDRLRSGHRLTLGWRRYIDVVERGHEVWVYFCGPHDFEPGVYIKGVVKKIDPARERIILRVREYNTDAPITDEETSRRVAKIVRPKGRQVFLLRSNDRRGWFCTPERCSDERCGSCPVLKAIPLVGPRSYCPPGQLADGIIDAVVPAHWVVPSRCYLGDRRLRRGIELGTELFYSFKAGERALADPVRGASRVRSEKRGLGGFDCIVPIPLSPDKARKGELHRTKELARKLGERLGVRVVELLSLKRPISKRRVLARGHSRATFRRRYRRALTVRRSARRYDHILLVDDVCTHGNTLAEAAQKIREVNDKAEIVAAAAGQMIVKECVVRRKSILARRT